MEALPANAESKPPVHVAIIMDGNGRWAKARGLPRIAGHKRGAEAVRRTVTGAAELGIQYLTLYGFSSENWKRPAAEVDDLMGLLRLYLNKEIQELHEKGVHVIVISGYAIPPIPKKKAAVILQKPFSAEDLLTALRTVVVGQATSH